MSRFRPNSSFLFLLLVVVSSTPFTLSSSDSLPELFNWKSLDLSSKPLFSVGNKASSNSTVLILAADRTYRKDPTDGFRYYTGGWNITNPHYVTDLRRFLESNAIKLQQLNEIVENVAEMECEAEKVVQVADEPVMAAADKPVMSPDDPLIAAHGGDVGEGVDIGMKLHSLCNSNWTIDDFDFDLDVTLSGFDDKDPSELPECNFWDKDLGDVQSWLANDSPPQYSNLPLSFAA